MDVEFAGPRQEEHALMETDHCALSAPSAHPAITMDTVRMKKMVWKTKTSCSYLKLYNFLHSSADKP